MRDGEQPLIVVFNTADEAVLLDHLQTDCPAATELARLFAIAAPVAAGATRDIEAPGHGLYLLPQTWWPMAR